MSFTRVLVGGFALALSSAALANAPQMRPGLWEFSMSGVPMKQTVCITPEMAKDVTKLGKDDKVPNSDCKSSTPKVSGKSTTFDVTCTKPSKMNTRMTLTAHDQDNFTMAQDYDMEMNGQRQKGSMTMTYKRIGECRK